MKDVVEILTECSQALDEWPPENVRVAVFNGIIKALLSSALMANHKANMDVLDAVIKIAADPFIEELKRRQKQAKH